MQQPGEDEDLPGGCGPVGRSAGGNDLVTDRGHGVEESAAVGVTRPTPEGQVFRIIVSPAQESRAEGLEEGKELDLGNILVGRAVHSSYSERGVSCRNFYASGHKELCTFLC
jgi:hypothetical protein